LNLSTRAAWQPAPETAPLDWIFIEGFRGDTVIGIHESELHATQPLLIDLHAGLARAQACDSDRITDTIDYSVVRTRLLRLLAEHKLQLLEALAETIAEILIAEFGAAVVRVKVVKPQKFPDLQAVGVQIERHAPTRPATPQGRSAAVLQLLASGMVPEKR
jgi:dihydroneopterin aldolase